VPPPKRHPYDQWSPDARALDLVGDKWTLLIVRDLMSGPRRFVELQRVLPGISTEQLRSRLNRMVADGMLTRKRYREVPPRVDYELTERAQELAPILAELARWGHEWAWSEPRATESIDLGAIFRLLPGLARDGLGLTGTVELTVDDAHENAPLTYVVTASGDGVTVAEDSGAKTDAYVRGPAEAWINALSPLGSDRGLRRGGNRALLEAVLRLIEPGAGRMAAQQDEAASATA
jgi:DNA-binding HxlR family transcriptional regulator